MPGLDWDDIPPASEPWNARTLREKEQRGRLEERLADLQKPSPARLMVWGIKAGLGEPFDIPPGWRFVAHLYTESFPDSSYLRILLEAV